MQGATGLALTKLDVLSDLKEIPVCEKYRLDGRELDDFPFPTLLDRCEPVLKRVPGWERDISGVRRWEDLPQAARDYVEMIERAVGCPITYVSVGADREAYIERKQA